MSKVSEKYFNPTYGKIYGTSILNSAVEMVDVPSSQYNALPAGPGVIGGSFKNIKVQCCNNIGSGLTLDIGGTLADGLVVEFQDLVLGDGYTDGNYTDVSTTGGTGTLATVNVFIAGGKVKDVTIYNPGSGYTIADTLSVDGTSGTSATVDIRSIQDDSITSITVNSGGTGYEVGDVVMITTGGNNAVVKIDAVTGGVVDSGGVVLINGGTEYTASATAQATNLIAGYYIKYDGLYSIHSSISFSDSTTTSHEINGTMFVIRDDDSFERLSGLSWTRTISSTNVGSAALAGSIDLEVGDFLLYGFENLHSSDTTLTLNNYSWTVDRIS